MRKSAPDRSECPPPPRKAPPVEDMVGLALSGGGIRSASFNLGVLQGLRYRKVLWMFDYLSTVSGGGFVGAWWSAWLSRRKRDPGDVFPLDEELEPQRRRESAVLHDTGGGTSPVPSLPDGTLIPKREDPIHFIRLFSNYLTPKTGAFSPDTWRMIAFYLRSLLLTWSVLLPFFLAAIIAAQSYYLFNGVAPAFLCDQRCDETLTVRLAHFWWPLKLLLTAAATLGLLWLAHSSARLGLALIGLAGIIVLAAILLGQLSSGLPDSGIDTAVLTVVVLCIAWQIVAHVVRSIRNFERSRTERVERVTGADHRSWLTQQLALLLKFGTFVSLLLLVAGFGHDLVRFVFDQGQQQLTQAGGVAGLIVTIVSTAYTIYKKSPTTTGTMREGPGRLGRILIVLAPPLVLIVLALLLAYAGHRLLVFMTTATGVDGGIASTLAIAVVWFAALQVGFAIFESYNDPSSPPAEGTFDWRRFVPRFLLQATGQAKSPGDRQAWYYLFSPRGWVRLAVLGSLLVMIAWAHDRSRAGLEQMLFGTFASVLASAILAVALAMTFAKRDWPIAIGSARPTGLLAVACFGATLCLLVNDGAYREAHAAAFVAFLLVAILIGIVIALGWLADPNLLSLHSFYKARLARAYLGASNTTRHNQDITDAAPGDDLPLKSLWNHDPGAPYHLINSTLNLVGSQDLAMSQRYAENFVMSRYHCGSARAGYRCTAQYMDGQLSLATAAATSGAAVSPTMGSRTPSAALALLMSLFNIRLGFWAPRPSGRRWNEPHARLWPIYLLRETLSTTGTLGSYCYLTDGGHFDNTGLYALVERGCRYIVICDCGADPKLGFDDIGTSIRRCRIDFGAEIDLGIDQFLALDYVTGTARTHVVAGTIRYQAPHLDMLKLPRAQDTGIIVWIKPSVTASSAADVRQYRRGNTDFPQQPTADQWYDESQFESYRRLGFESVCAAFDDDALQSLGSPGTFDRILQCFQAIQQKTQSAQLRSAAAAGSSNPPPILYSMDGDDLALQRSRVALGEGIARIIDHGLNEHSIDLVRRLVITQHNAALYFSTSQQRVGAHMEEVEALYNYLMKKLAAVPTGRFNADIASAIGNMRHNMLVMIRK